MKFTNKFRVQAVAGAVLAGAVMAGPVQALAAEKLVKCHKKAGEANCLSSLISGQPP